MYPAFFYLTLKIIHILSACVVIGYLVYDVFIFARLGKTRSKEAFKSLKREILKPSALCMGVGFLLLIGSGAMLGAQYFGGDLGFWQNDFQKLLWLKIALVASLFVLTPFSLYFIIIRKTRDPFREYYHHIALVICVCVVVVAKLMLG